MAWFRRFVFLFAGRNYLLEFVCGLGRRGGDGGAD
ncbi:hypothetical protein LCGC14_2039310 [marine sediment metagenome]|uniref:Uncharacterized protein n=1 Tax=marine sediment metagenome TaxID=412755 RepID=A0A0F9HPE9_9ZZZZ